MKRSTFIIPTLKESQSETSIVSHDLMLRAGMIRKLASGLYTWLPLGFKVLKKVENVVREEMDAIGSQEMVMPTIQPKELWDETNRWQQFGPQLLKIKDRHERDFCFGPTHEEVITDLVRNDVNSYRQLPITLYQIQVKFRDEIRPRFGVMRAREFLMKDAYSFHLDEECLTKTYNDMYKAYSNIFTRLGLTFKAVEADSGNIGGKKSQEFHVIADSGEDALAFCPNSDYAANVEKATFAFQGNRPEGKESLTKVKTPGIKNTTEQAKFLKRELSNFLKTYLVEGEKDDVVALIVRGDHTLSELKAEKIEGVKVPFTLISEDKLKELSGGGVGFVGPIGINIKIFADRDVSNMADFCCGANEEDTHYAGVNWKRDCPEPEFVDIREVVAGDKSPDGKGNLEIARGIEVGHIFQLGSKYSQDMKANVLDKNGKAKNLIMGCYGVGVSRIVAAAIEQNNDDLGIVWPEEMAPFKLVLIGLGMKKDERVKQECEKLYNNLKAKGVDVLFDDRDERPGVMFSDAELIGIPHRIVISKNTLKDDSIEYQKRTEKDKKTINLSEIEDFLKKVI